MILVGRTLSRLEKVRAELGSNCICFCHDVSDLENIKENVNKEFDLMQGKIDILVNNAGIGSYRDFLSYRPEEFEETYKVNLGGAFFMTQAFAEKWMEKERQGVVLNISSNGGMISDPVPYSLAKAAMIHFTKGIARKYIKDGLRCNCICPGVTVSDIDEFPRQFTVDGNMYTADVRNERAFLPDEVAELALFLASDLACCINGQIIASDGGHALL